MASCYRVPRTSTGRSASFDPQPKRLRQDGAVIRGPQSVDRTTREEARPRTDRWRLAGLRARPSYRDASAVSRMAVSIAALAS